MVWIKKFPKMGIPVFRLRAEVGHLRRKFVPLFRWFDFWCHTSRTFQSRSHQVLGERQNFSSVVNAFSLSCLCSSMWECPSHRIAPRLRDEPSYPSKQNSSCITRMDVPHKLCRLPRYPKLLSEGSILHHLLSLFSVVCEGSPMDALPTLGTEAEKTWTLAL